MNLSQDRFRAWLAGEPDLNACAHPEHRYVPRTIASVTSASETALAWDGPQSWMFGGNCQSQAGLDKSQLGWGHFFTREGHRLNAIWENLENNPILHDDWESSWPESLAELRAQNKDNPNQPWVRPAPGMRFRHNNDEVANVLFVDGHVESFKLGEFKRRMLLVNFK